ncbi:hypothetical protein OH77DRAFT_1437386 [Trametes cingulata]|nr:hypothetical protein OH77DRAFT_1437386 [Trametes cingulata]
MSLLKAFKSVTSLNGAPDTPKRTKTTRFSFLPRHLTPSPQQSPRAPALDIELSDAGDSFWTSPNVIQRRAASEDSRNGGEVTLERSFTLSILEGRKHPVVEAAAAHSPSHTLKHLPADSPRGSTGTSNTCVSGGEPVLSVSLKALSPIPSPSPGPSPPPVPPRSRARSASLSSSRSVSAERRRRKPSLRPQALGLPEVRESRPDEALSLAAAHEGGLPPKCSTEGCPERVVAYRFARAGPFGMVIEAEEREREKMEGLDKWRYHIGVGINVWTLRSWVTSLRRGGDDGVLVAEIESAASTGGTTVTMGDVSRSSKEVLSRTLGSKMYYIGDGTSIRWNLGETKWEAFFDTVELATFDPTPPRRLVMQPIAHRFFDHIVIALLLLTREKEEAACSGSRAVVEIETAPPSPLG